jgi:3-isopropylmalate/(R)-2-methylmalate dehydratase large subunit
MEFCGEAIRNLPMSSRLTLANMAIEAGGKNGIIEPDKITLQYVKSRAKRPYRLYRSDPEAHYADVKEYDVSKIHPQVALPHIPSNVKDVREVGKIEIDQVVIGSCTNGHLDDLRVAAKILKGKKIAPSLRLIIIPATPHIYQQALKEGLFEIFLSAGAVISPPTCGPCLGGHMGVLAEGERALATTNRNFRGRMGHARSEVYLSNPAVAAASAVKGRICHPEKWKRLSLSTRLRALGLIFETSVAKFEAVPGRVLISLCIEVGFEIVSVSIFNSDFKTCKPRYSD